MADQIARIGELKHALEQVGRVSTERTGEIAAVLRLARTALPGVDLPGGVTGDVADGIAAALGPVLVHVVVGAIIGGVVVLCVELWHKLRPAKAAH